MGWRILVNFIRQLILKLRTHSGFHDLFMSHTIYPAKFEQTIIHQHVHLRRESQYMHRRMC
jgi:hypothetical protein